MTGSIEIAKLKEKIEEVFYAGKRKWMERNVAHKLSINPDVTSLMDWIKG